MAGLNITLLRGLLKMGFRSGYNLYISSGLKKMTLKVNQENMPVIFHFGPESLFDGYLITSKILCDGYVMGSTQIKAKSFIINDLAFI